MEISLDDFEKVDIRIGKFIPEILVLGFPDETGDVVLIAPDRDVPVGGKLF